MLRELLTADKMRESFAQLDRGLTASVHLVVGGGAAMALAFDYPLATEDVDAFTARGSVRLSDLDSIAKQVAKKLGTAPDWLNSHFETFTGVLPNDYAIRLRDVYRGAHLQVDALGPEDLLIMKCFAGRDKDLPHARRLVRIANDLEIVDAHLSHLCSRRYPGAEDAADFFDDLRDDEGI